MAVSKSSPFELVYQVVRKIPKGKVLTYGVVSHLINSRLSAQGVGWALNALKSTEQSVPWHRVVNAKGGLSTYKNPDIPMDLQKALLENEGIKFNQEGLLDLKKYLWTDYSGPREL